MTKLTEQDMKLVSETLGIPEEQVLRMSEADLDEAANKIEGEIPDLKRLVAGKNRQLDTLRSENVNLRLTNIGLKAACAARQIQIGFLRTIHDIKSLLRND